MNVFKPFTVLRKSCITRQFSVKKPIPPKCIECKYNVLINGEHPICRLFCYNTLTTNAADIFHFYVNAEECRRDPELCGPMGSYFKPKENVNVN